MYSLPAAVMYQLLTGKPPFEGPRREGDVQGLAMKTRPR